MGCVRSRHQTRPLLTQPARSPFLSVTTIPDGRPAPRPDRDARRESRNSAVSAAGSGDEPLSGLAIVTSCTPSSANAESARDDSGDADVLKSAAL
jgi:hypothetical protein